MKCPICGCENFYVKDDDDGYEIYEFSCSEETVKFDSSLEEKEIPQMTDDTETYCNKCAWHGKFRILN
jgi:hypothetical protein